MVCVKCQNNGLWMRAIVLKEINQHSVSVMTTFHFHSTQDNTHSYMLAFDRSIMITHPEQTNKKNPNLQIASQKSPDE